MMQTAKHVGTVRVATNPVAARVVAFDPSVIERHYGGNDRERGKEFHPTRHNHRRIGDELNGQHQ